MPQPKTCRLTAQFPTAIKLSETDGSMTVDGLAMPFNVLSEDRGGFRIRALPGAFSDVLKRKPDCRALFNHEESGLLARTTAGTLRLNETDQGLACEIDLPNTTLGRDIGELVRTGVLTQMSVSILVANPRWVMEGKQRICEFTRIDELLDVSLVTYPAFEETSAAMRFGSTAGGIDLAVLFDSLLKAEAGVQLQAEEQAEVKEMIAKLSTLLPGDEPPASQGMSVADARARLASLQD